MKKNQRYAALGLTAGLLGGGAAGLVLGTPGFSAAAGTAPSLVQQEDTPDDTTTADDTTDDTTTDDTTTDDMTQRGAAMGDHLRESLQVLVDDGTLTAEQADAVAEHLVANRPDRGELGGRGHGHHRGGAFDGEVVAGIIGIDAESLREQLRAGSSLAEIAEANGVDPQVVIDALVAEATEHLALAVENGRLTQAEADERLADLTERTTERVNTAPEPRD